MKLFVTSGSWAVNSKCFHHILMKIFVVACFNGIQSSVGGGTQFHILFLCQQHSLLHWPNYLDINLHKGQSNEQQYQGAN